MSEIYSIQYSYTAMLKTPKNLGHNRNSGLNYDGFRCMCENDRTY